MGEMRDSDWSRENLLRSDWLLPSVATITTQSISFHREGDRVNEPVDPYVLMSR